MFKTIVVGLDGSPPSRRALEAACAMVRAFDGELHLVHALEGRAASAAQNSSNVSPVLADAAEQASAAGVTPSSSTACHGDPAEEILTVAGIYGADLIVMGRRGLGNLQGLFAGSTSQEIEKSASFAVLTVK